MAAPTEAPDSDERFWLNFWTGMSFVVKVAGAAVIHPLRYDAAVKLDGGTPGIETAVVMARLESEMYGYFAGGAAGGVTGAMVGGPGVAIAGAVVGAGLGMFFASDCTDRRVRAEWHRTHPEDDQPAPMSR